ncbi:uncharacterized protein RJT20DRAFT_125181 [Scheffersomyces xylosifermentans]|uniref:uncharacterized protein n=1 Tax=Scheffersomyces xylosifermentans TaxID=1304137 RepID=UPI00315DF1ED
MSYKLGLEELGISPERILSSERLKGPELAAIYSKIPESKFSIDSICSNLKSNFTEGAILEGYISEGSLKDVELEAIFKQILPNLEISESKIMDWTLNTNRSKDDFSTVIQSLRILRELFYKQYIPSDGIWVLSYYVNPNLPWTSEITSQIVDQALNASETVVRKIQKELPNYIESEFRPNLLIFKKPARASLQGGLNPRLGYGGVKREILEEDTRRNWKNSNKVKSLSMAWFIISFANETFWAQGNWHVVTSFILNVGDDHEPLFKLQGTKLLTLLLDKLEQYSKLSILKNSGLNSILIESTRKCLVYYPSTTDLETSLALLSEAYPCLYKLIEIGNSQPKWQHYIEILHGNVLASISHLMGTVEAKLSYPLITLLLRQVEIIVDNYVKTNILMSTTRILFLLNQIMTNPDILDNSRIGASVVQGTLKAQQAIIEQFQDSDDGDLIELIGSHKFDLLGAWLVLLKRLSNRERDDAETIRIQLQTNFDLFRRIESKNSKEEKAFANLVDTLKIKSPVIKELLQNM